MDSRVAVTAGVGLRLGHLWTRTRKGCGCLLLLALPVLAWADPFDDLVKQLGNADDAVRADAAGKIAQIGGPRAEKQFREMIGSGNPERRQIGVVGLLQISEETADLELVRGRLQDESSIVRWSAALALGQAGRKEAIPWLTIVAKEDKSEEVREAAANGIQKLESTIHWLRSWPEARATKRKMLVYFHVRGSELCEQFESGVLSDTAVVRAVQELACVRMDASKQQGEARRFDIRGAPTVLLLDAQGNELARTQGLVEKDKLLAKLRESETGRLTFREARRLADRDPSNVEANWKVAETYLEENREELANTYLRNVIAADEANAHGHTDRAMFALGYAFGKAGKHAQAVYCMNQLLSRFPSYADRDKALYCLALSELALGQKDKARGSLTKLVREFPGTGAGKAGRLALSRLGEK